MPETYKNYVVSNFLRALRKGNDFYKLCSNDVYFEAYRRFVFALLSDPNTVVRMAVLSEDHDVVFGFAMHRGEVLDFWFVFKDHRGLGIGAHLFPDGITTISHFTRNWLALWSHDRYKDIIFNPFV